MVETGNMIYPGLHNDTISQDYDNIDTISYSISDFDDCDVKNRTIPTISRNTSYDDIATCVSFESNDVVLNDHGLTHIPEFPNVPGLEEPAKEEPAPVVDEVPKVPQVPEVKK